MRTDRFDGIAVFVNLTEADALVNVVLHGSPSPWPLMFSALYPV
jgi:hypothetical protein